MLSCECEFDDPEWWYDSGAEVAPLATRRARKCCSCSARIAVGEDCKRFRRWRTPAPESIEERIYGEDGEVSIAAWYLCDRCTGLYESLESLGFCGMLGDNLIDTCREYAQMQRDAGVFRGQMVIPTRPQGHLQESNMDKVRITNPLGTEENEYQAPVAISVNGVAWGPVVAPQVDTAKLAQGNVAADTSESGNGKPVGPHDQFTGLWKAGDRQPTDMEQMMKPDWFRDLPNGNAAPQTTRQAAAVADIAFVPGGITRIPYPTGSQKRYRLTGVVAGLGALAFQPLPGKSGIGRFSIVGAETDSCPLDDSAIGTEPGVMVGPSVLQAYGQSNHFSEAFTVGKPGGGGYGPELPTDKPTYVNVRFGTGVPANLTVEIAAHDR